jgi:threonine synthase
MKFVSLTNPRDVVSFEEALAKGIADGGGLYVPEHIPQLSAKEISQLVGADRQEVARIMLAPWVADEISVTDLMAIIQTASTFDTPVVKVGNKKVLELFHGPTMAFKDVAARYLAAFMSYFNQKSGSRSMVLVATSGDTGGAIAHGFADIDGIELIVLYPKDRVSRLQREQLRRVAKNVRSLEVDGDFNDCQELVKQALSDAKLNSQFNLTSANSINIGRLLPQITYYASICSQLGTTTGRVVVPTGNLGNLTAGLIARAMGVPIQRFVAATNANDSLVRYLATGDYKPRATIHTITNAMDVSAPNNFPRFRWLFDEDIASIRTVVKAIRVSDEDTIATIKQVYSDTGYLLDPHTAIGWRASQILGDENQDIIVATASPLKFVEEIFAKTGIAVNNTHLLEELRQRPERYTKIGKSLAELAEFLHG